MRIWLSVTLTLFVLSFLLEGSLHVLFTDRVKPVVRFLQGLTVFSTLALLLAWVWRWALHVN